VIALATRQEYLNAANKPPSARSASEERLVQQGQNMQEVRNADFKAREQERIHGPSRR
jgi:hypothetical protein